MGSRNELLGLSMELMGYFGHRNEIQELSLRAIALRQRESRNCGLFVVYKVSRQFLYSEFYSTVEVVACQKSRKLLPFITVILTSIKRSPVLSGRGRPASCFCYFEKGDRSSIITNNVPGN